MMEELVSIDFTSEEVEQIILMMESTTVLLKHAEPALKLLNKFKGGLK